MRTHSFVHVKRHLVIYFLVYVVNVETVPPDYCLRPLNTSDCNKPPTPVISYYLSGSRCEVEYWRGCPTYNKFENEYECAFTCLYVYGRTRIVDPVQKPPPPEDNLLNALMEIPENNLTIIDNIVNEIDKEIVKLQLPASNVTETDIETTIAAVDSTEPEDPSETTTVLPEEEHEGTIEEAKEDTAEKTELSGESGLPEEVETP